MLIGIVGKPNVGKSTFFKASTLSDVLIANYPFATIKPNEGIGYVKINCIDKEFNVKCNPRTGFCINSKRFVPIKLIDVAGLVPGASKGKGLGNQFLDNLREADAFIQIIDLSGKTNEEGKQTENYDVTKDIIFLEEELDYWYLGILQKIWNSFIRKASSDKIPLHDAIAKQFSGLKVDEEQVKQAILKSGLNHEQAVKWTEKELLKFTKTLRKISKPMIIAGNKIDEKDSEKNLKRLKEKLSLTLFHRTPTRRVNFLKVLLLRRIAELKFVVERDDIANLQNSSQRYSTTAGQITEVITKNSLNSEKEYFRKLFKDHTLLLEQLQTNYKYDSGQWLFLKWDIDYLKLYSERLSN